MKSIKGIPLEDKRFEVTQDQILQYFQLITQLVQGLPAHFVFNMDEMGHQDWADRHSKVCIVPVEHDADFVYVPVSRTGKRLTMVACIAADGSYVKPLIVVPRKTIDDDFQLTGLTHEKVTVFSQTKGYIDRDIFDAWFEEVFLPDLDERRKRHVYTGPAVLILDNCSAHSTTKFDVLCQKHDVVPCYLPPHGSNQVQPLDLCLFGLTKRHLQKVNRMEALNIQTIHIARVVNSFMSAATPTNIVKTFQNGGISLMVDQGTIRCQFSPETARCLIRPLIEPIAFPEVEDDEADIDEQEYLEQCADLLYGLGADSDEASDES